MQDAKTILARWSQMTADRAPWDAQWQRVSDFALPRKGNQTRAQMPGPGTNSANRLFDTTAIESVSILASGHSSAITPAGTQWFAWEAPDSIKSDEADKWYNGCSEKARNLLAAITTMQPGTLAEEYREHPDAEGKGVVRRGPYFKYQCWHDGRNLSRRVPVTQATQLRQDIDNAKLFGQLTTQLGQLNIQHTLALRAAAASTADEVQDAKKNSTRKRAKKGSVKPKHSSPKPRRA